MRTRRRAIASHDVVRATGRAVLGFLALPVAVACGGGSQGAGPDGGSDATEDGTADSSPIDTGSTDTGADAPDATTTEAGVSDSGAPPSDASPGTPEAGPECNAGAVQCANNGVQTCGAGGQWGAPSPCVNQTCANGACTGVCAPNQTQCSGSDLQTCDTAGQWAAPIACPGAVTCHQGSCCPIPVAPTTGGPVQGQLSGGACQYLGIPYAAPPVGALRWKPPQPAASWTATHVSAPAPGCPQLPPGSTCGSVPTDEDCLYLNVWTPPTLTSAAPVMVNVHGGAFKQGCGTGTDGANLAAEQGVVVVAMNYRLGPLGFLSLPDLRSEDPSHPSSGNYGIEDQIAAFKWVQQNAAAFGGDPNNVTIFGGSAGGISMYVHMASPKSTGLFERVILSEGFSGGGEGDSNVFVSSEATADQTGASFVSATPCAGASSPLACLRSASVSSLLAAAATASSTWIPVVDGFVLQSDPATVLSSGTFNKAPTLLLTAGSVANDLDYLFCPTLRMARACAAAGVPTFVSNLTYALQVPGWPPTPPWDGEEGVFIFDTPGWDGITFTPQEQVLGQQMRAYWGSMAATGNPNGGGRFPWPAFNLSTEPNLVLDTTLSTQAALGVGASCGLPASDAGASDAASE